MKKSLLSVTGAAVLLAATTTGVQAQEYDETVYIVSTGVGGIEVNTEALLQRCNDLRQEVFEDYDMLFSENPLVFGFQSNGLPISAVASTDYYSVHTKKTNGSVLNHGVKKVGSLLSCQDWTTWDSIGLLYEIEIDGKRLIAHGGGTALASTYALPWRGGSQLMAWQLPAGAPVGFPALGVGLYNNSLTVLPAIPAGFPLPGGGAGANPGGNMTANLVLDSLGADDQFSNNGIHVIRLFEPIAEQE